MAGSKVGIVDRSDGIFSRLRISEDPVPSAPEPPLNVIPNEEDNKINIIPPSTNFGISLDDHPSLGMVLGPDTNIVFCS